MGQFIGGCGRGATQIVEPSHARGHLLDEEPFDLPVSMELVPMRHLKELFRQKVSTDAMRWGDAAQRYHKKAETRMDEEWARFIWPAIYNCDLSSAMDFACGRGRNTKKLLEAGAGHVTMVDVHPDNIRRCRMRFRGPPVSIVQNNGRDLHKIRSASHTLIYSWDSMVHFDLLVIGNYLAEFARVLAPGGHVFIHHSNYANEPGANFTKTPHWRNYMTYDIMRHMAIRSGLEVVTQTTIPWGKFDALDCITLAQKHV